MRRDAVQAAGADLFLRDAVDDGLDAAWQTRRRRAV
jgi:hypothetical protein